MRRTDLLRLPLVVNRNSKVPLYLQIADQIEEVIRTTAVAAGDQIPSSRALANEIGISRSVVLAAYTELFDRGVLEQRRGAGTFVRKPPDRSAQQSSQPPTPTRHDSIDMTPGRANLEHFPVTAWRAAWQQAASLPPGDADLPVAGWPELRQQIASYLTKVRGVRCDWQQVVVTRGIASGTQLFLRAALGGATDFQIDPHRQISVVQRQMRDGTAGALVVTLGGVGLEAGAMSMERRWSVLACATAQRMHVVEVDNGTELLGEGYVPPLRTMAPERVAHVGDLSHLFNNELRLAYLVSPVQLSPIVQRQLTPEDTADGIAQRAIGGLLASGRIARYANLLADTYAHKRARAREQLAAAGADLTRILVSGTHVVLPVADSLDSVTIRTRLHRLGITWSGPHGVTTVPQWGRAVVLGIGQLRDEQIDQAATAISAALHELRTGRRRERFCSTRPLREPLPS